MKITKRDYIYLIVFSLFFFCLGAFRLGDFNEFPVTGININKDNELIIKIDNSMKEKYSEYYLGIYSGEIYGNPSIAYSKDGINYVKEELNFTKLLSNYYLLLFKDKYLEYSYIKLTVTENWKINELLLFKDKDIFKLDSDFTINNQDAKLLFDEQPFLMRNEEPYQLGIFDTINYTGFDEMIYKLSPNEIINNNQSFENTHPPLGKAIMTIGVILFGYNFFGVRIMSLVFSIMLLILIYLFGKKITKSSNFALLSMIIFGFDTMRFVISRLCTIGNFDIFFIVLMFFIMYDFVISDKLKFDINDSLRLFSCGIVLGLAISCKWTGFYGAFGLAILFLIGLVGRLKKIKTEINKTKSLEIADDLNLNIKEERLKELKKECSFKNILNVILPCFVYFILVPFSIYTISYIFFMDSLESSLFIRMIDNQFHILKHHTVDATLEIGTSSPYLWPIGQGLMKSLSASNIKEKTSAMVIFLGNPAIVLLSIPMILISIYRAIKKDLISLYILISGLSLYVPWLLINRPLYIYHYYLFIPFLTLMIVYNFYKINLKHTNIAKAIIIIFILILIGFFLLMFPMISGIYINNEYFDLMNNIPIFSTLKYK